MYMYITHCAKINLKKKTPTTITVCAIMCYSSKPSGCCELCQEHSSYQLLTLEETCVNIAHFVLMDGQRS